MNTPVQMCGSRSEDTRARPRPVLSRDADAGFTRNLRSSLSLRLVRVDREGPRFTGNRAQDRKLGPALLRQRKKQLSWGRGVPTPSINSVPTYYRSVPAAIPALQPPGSRETRIARSLAERGSLIVARDAGAFLAPIQSLSSAAV